MRRQAYLDAMFEIEIDREADGRWIAEIAALPGRLAALPEVEVTITNEVVGGRLHGLPDTMVVQGTIGCREDVP